MTTPHIVLDTNILIAAQRSRRGASAKLLSLVGLGLFDLHLSAALVLEYEDVLLRYRAELGLTQDDVEDLVDALCALSTPHEIYYQWRPYLRDPGDEFILELAVVAGCDYIITFNKRDFTNVERFGIQPLTPSEFLKAVGAAL
ncbi:MAG: putative toxin-antitoxin system toxin component, PIN family [Caldilineaceae bacterium]|nr:putative toxin-antitoxin system toxin component, PIN family [Caldilineaceae bacterium]